MYVESVELKLDRGVTRRVKTGGGVRQWRCLSPILFKLYSEYVIKEAFEGFEDYKIGGK
jgi:hypothetical protein